MYEEARVTYQVKNDSTHDDTEKLIAQINEVIARIQLLRTYIALSLNSTRSTNRKFP